MQTVHVSAISLPLDICVYICLFIFVRLVGSVDGVDVFLYTIM